MTPEGKLGVTPEKEKQEPYPESYRKFLELRDGKYVNTAYDRPIKRVETSGALEAEYEIPLIVLSSSPEDIRLSGRENPRYVELNYEAWYDDHGYPHTEYDRHEGLENYCLFFKDDKPLYVFDNHVHAKFAWQEAKEAGILGEKVALIRLDAHMDMTPGSEGIDSSREGIKEAIVAGRLRINNFTESDLREGSIDKMYYCSGQADLDVIKEAQKLQTIKGRPGYVSSLGYELELNTALEYARKGKFTDISRKALSQADYLVNLARRLKEDGYDVIFDLDFDIFTKPDAEQLTDILWQVAREADVVTCATSPRYRDQREAVAMAQKFVREYLQ